MKNGIEAMITDITATTAEAEDYTGEDGLLSVSYTHLDVYKRQLVIALGAGLGIWGVINLLEGYGNDNPGANAHVR